MRRPCISSMRRVMFRGPGSTQQTQATFIDILLVYATVDEITFYYESTSNNNLRAFYGTTSKDLEFKKLTWSGLLTAI